MELAKKAIKLLVGVAKKTKKECFHGRQRKGKIKSYNFFSQMSKVENIKNVKFRNGKAYIKLEDGRIYRYDPNIKVAQLYSVPDEGVFEKKETEFLKKIIEPGQVCFDIGGSFGWYTVLLSKLVGENGQVHVFGPILENYNILLENIEINLCKNVFPNNLAIDEQTGERKLFITDTGVSGSFALHDYHKKFSTHKSKVVSLDCYCERNNIPKIDFIKADIEGAELLMLRGGENIIKTSMPIMFLEIQEKSIKLFGYKPQDVFQFLVDKGFESYYVGNSSELIRVNNWPSASLPDYNFIFLPSRQ